MKARILITIVLLAGIVTSATPQTRMQETAQKTNDRPATSIAGRVVNESGQPVPNAIVVVAATGARSRERRNVVTDEDGKFRAEDLPRGLYHFGAFARGYVSGEDISEPVYHKPGDSVTLQVRKGGVITGTVTNSAGEPVIGIRVVAVPHRDSEGQPARASGVGFPSYTDDRGVYRIFGLSPGYHLVAVGGKVPGFTTATAFDEESRTFYPSSTRDTAVEVSVGYGSESTGINIRYRGDRGYAVSGLITGGGPSESRIPITAQLIRASDGTVEATTSSQIRGAEYSFAFYGVPEGDYYIVAQRFFNQNDDGARSRLVPVKVRDHEVTGVQVTLEPLSSIAGRLVLESATDDKSVKCEPTRSPSIEETLVSVRHDQKKEDLKISPLLNTTTSARSSPDEKGEFLLQGLEAGHYRLETRALDEAWYIRSITLPATARTATEADAGRRGFALKAGQRVNGATITLATGAASLRGRVVADKQNDLLPDRLRVHLVPAEQEAADNVLRFAEIAVQSDGTFAITNLTPGRYWLFVRQASKEESGERSPRPIHWDTSSRASLRREAPASNISIDLKPCERMSDYKLRYAPSTEAPAKSASR